MLAEAGGKRSPPFIGPADVKRFESFAVLRDVDPNVALKVILAKAPGP
jgi:hypothetical protein